MQRRVVYAAHTNASQANRTAFEKTFVSKPELVTSLHEFAEHKPPTVLWGAAARWKDLYIFVAVRFLTAPNHVLDCEGFAIASFSCVHHLVRP